MHAAYTLPRDRQGSKKRPRIKLPKGYDSEAAFLQEMRDLFYEDQSADKLNRDAAYEDMKFLVGDQWDDATRARREAARKPVLTVNRLPAFVGQVLGARRMKETEIKIVPDTGGTRAVANVREGLVRSIQKRSNATDAYDTALGGSVAAGIGAFQVELCESTNDIWTQEIRVCGILDPFSVVWDRMLTEKTGKDASRAFLIDTLPLREFYERWPWATPADMMTETRGDVRMAGWIGVDDVRIVNYWRMREKKRTYALLNNGNTVDITDLSPDVPEEAEVLASINMDKNGAPYVREVNVRYAQMYVCSALDVLEGPYDLPIDRIPIFRVPGWEFRIGQVQHRWGIVRFAKDPQRLHNYWRSILAEKLMQTPRAVWAAADTAVVGRENQWRNSHLSDDPLLVWNAESGQKPERVPPAIMEDALLAQAQITTQDIKDVTNVHEANLGMPSNEVSGRAIDARQRVSDVGTAVYHDNLTQAIQEAGRVINDLIPTVYDTARVVKIVTPDDQETLQAINAFDVPGAIDITAGRYSVTAVTGPSYATKRIESAENMMALAQAMPQVFGIAPDLLVAAQDWPDAEKIARRFRNNLPPGTLAPDEQTPETMQREMSAKQQQGIASQLDLAMAQAKVRAQESQTTLNLARAQNFAVQSQTNPQKVLIQAMDSQSRMTDRAARADMEALRVARGK